jgi:HAD superfamily hydrolase (TIGR01490 family)
MALQNLALFDLDHTLIPIDSDFSWGEFTMSLGWVDSAEFKRKNDAFYADYKNGTLDIGEYVRFSTDAICRQGEPKSMAARGHYISGVVRPVIHPQAVELVRKHQTEGDATIIVTATNEFVTRPIASLFGVDELIAVELERESKAGVQGWFNGNIRGTPSFKEGKVARVQAWLDARQLNWDQIHTTFYSDSINDLPLLEKVTSPVATNPDPRLRTIATERGWRILDLF